MPGENIQDWSTSATLNGNADSAINWAEGQPRASVNNSSRSMMAAHAKQRNLLNGSIITGGIVNGLTFFSGLDYTTTPTGLVVRLKIGPALTNTGPCTLNMDNIGQVQIVDGNTGAYLVKGELLAGSYRDFLWDGTYWILLGLSAATAQAVSGPANLRVFTATGTYPTTSAAIKVLVMCKGGGGGGGGSANTIFGGGGGEGAISWKLTTAAALSGQTVTIGDGGIGTGTGEGTVGGESSIGTIVTAPGGGFGRRGDTTLGVPGAGGSGGTNDWGEPGIPGQGGGVSLAVTSGGGRGGGIARGNGVANSGGGGAGSDSSAFGGSGGSGIIVCYEYGVI